MNTRPLVIALFASVSLNLFVVGAVVGGLVIGHRVQMKVSHQAPRGGPGSGLWEAGRALPVESRRAYQQVLRDEAAAARRTLAASRDARHAAWRKLATDPVDIEGVRKDLSNARSLELSGRASIEDHLVLFAAGLPLEQRAQLADHLSRPRRDRPMGGGGGPMGPPPRGPEPE
jgi:hypothetical protein